MIIAAVVLYVAYIFILKQLGIQPGAIEQRSSVAAPADTTDAAPQALPAAEASPEPTPPVATVEALPKPASNDYPPCSATVTDHCVDK